MNPAEVHHTARDWAQVHLSLRERAGDDRLWDARGRSYKIKGRTGSEERFDTSFDFRYGHHDFDFLIGVILARDGEVIRAFRADRATFYRFEHSNIDSLRFRLSQSGPEKDAVDWLVGP